MTSQFTGERRVLAEVSDKIPSVAFFWCLHLAAAAVTLGLTLLSQPRAALLLLLPVTLAWAALFAYVALVADDPLGDVTAEMGRTYYVQQAAAGLLPAAAVVGAAVINLRRESREDRRAGPTPRV
jgi:hypothetical protein